MKTIKVAELFELRLKIANSSDAPKFAHLFSNYELMSEALDSLLEGLDLMVSSLEKDGVDESFLLIKAQKELLESAITSVYGQISAIDGKLQELNGS
jgi:hypothetical protein